jgi:hypothetical protein
MTTKSIHLTPDELTAIIAQAVSGALSANSKPAKAPKPKAEPVALSAKLYAAVEKDEKDPATGYYRCFATLIARKGIKKYGKEAKFDPATVKALQKAYGIQ